MKVSVWLQSPDSHRPVLAQSLVSQKPGLGVEWVSLPQQVHPGCRADSSTSSLGEAQAESTASQELSLDFPQSPSPQDRIRASITHYHLLPSLGCQPLWEQRRGGPRRGQMNFQNHQDTSPLLEAPRSQVHSLRPFSLCSICLPAVRWLWLSCPQPPGTPL